MANLLETRPAPHRIARPAEAGPGQPVTHLTIDPVALDLMQALARPVGLHVIHHEPRDGEPPTGPAVIAIDTDTTWDTASARHRGIEALLAQLVRPPVLALHGWNIEADLARRLRDAGCLVSGPLDEDFVNAIARAARAIPPPP